MGTYDVQQVCVNGHQITDRYHRQPAFRKNFCEQCGADTIHACPKCNTEIKGDYDVPGVVAIGFRTPVPSHCDNCGSPFPWWTKNPDTDSGSAASSHVLELMHPLIQKVAEGRLKSGHHADAVEAALKEVNVRVKNIWLGAGNAERDGPDLMFNAFDLQKPLIRLGDANSQSGRSVQEGYKHLFAGAMMGIRNPNAHENISISAHRALQFLVLASLLMETLDESGAA